MKPNVEKKLFPFAIGLLAATKTVLKRNKKFLELKVHNPTLL